MNERVKERRRKKERKYKPETECLSMKRHRDLLQGIPDIAIKTYLEGG